MHTYPFKPFHFFLMFLLALGYVLFAHAQWSYGYIDFGDGNYMYIGWQIAGGAVVYRDILAPQPPMHLYLGALVYKIAVILSVEPLWAFRAASIVIHLITICLIAALARRAYGRPGVAVIAVAIYLWLPIGFRWALGWQSEPLEIVWLLAMALAALRGTRGADIFAGIFATLAAMTNLTAAPFLLIAIIYMFVTAPRRALWMAIPSIILAAAITMAMEGYTGGYFLNNVVFNQVGTYPKEGLIKYALLDKLLPQSGNVIMIEGFFLFIGLIGLARFMKHTPLDPVARGGLAWFFVGTLGAILYVTKGGTVDYIFSLSEPAVAILAAGELYAWIHRWWIGIPGAPAALQRLAGTPVALAIAFFALAPGAAIHYQLYKQYNYELPENETLNVRSLIRQYSKPGDKILAPPFYAFLARRPIWGHYSEIFIWTINYRNDMAARNDAGDGARKIRGMCDAINVRSLPIVILEMDQTGVIPPVMRALMANYEPLQPDVIRTRNTRLGVFIPAPNGAQPAPAKWRDFQRNLVQVYGMEGARKFGWLQM
ncbi:glycosyltransferase family 39 protein [bacterium]|nr:glycosyltransferase family 39 protein [bacterium]